MIYSTNIITKMMFTIMVMLKHSFNQFIEVI